MRLVLLAGLLLAVTPAKAQNPYVSITGHVVDAETSAPVEGVGVFQLVCQAADRPETCRPGRGSRAATADAQGRFSVVALAPMVWTLHIQHEGYCSTTTMPYDEPERFRLRWRLDDQLRVSVESRTDLTDAQRRALLGQQDALAQSVLPRPHHVEIALRRPPCTAE